MNNNLAARVQDFEILIQQFCVEFVIIITSMSYRMQVYKQRNTIKISQNLNESQNSKQSFLKRTCQIINLHTFDPRTDTFSLFKILVWCVLLPKHLIKKSPKQNFRNFFMSVLSFFACKPGRKNHWQISHRFGNEFLGNWSAHESNVHRRDSSLINKGVVISIASNVTDIWLIGL